MRSLKFFSPAIMVLCVGAITACGGSDNNGAKTGGGGAVAVNVEDAPFASEIQKAGFQAVFVKKFPSQVPRRNARVVVYRAVSGGDRGGVIYTNRFEEDPDVVVWHWYFDDAAPDSITAVELNDDGLWDVRIHLAGGGKKEFIQDVDFTFVSRGRNDLIATNGKASHPENAWRVFDGDSLSVWEASGGKVYLEVATPLGVTDGILTVQLGATNQPGEVKVKVDGKEVKKFDLQKTTSKQLFQLDGALNGGTIVRLEFSGGVSVSEIGIK